MERQRQHRYRVAMTWTGNLGSGTSAYRDYSRAHEITAGDITPIPGSADPVFLGDAGRYNPEQLLVGALSACHMLWYLHLCADAGIRVLDYADEPEGVLVEAAGGPGGFREVVLRPRVTLDAGADPERARALHDEAHRLCFIANSVRCPVSCEPVFESADSGA